MLTYEMLLGQSPFKGDDEDDIFDAILEDEPLYPMSMPGDAVSLLTKVCFPQSYACSSTDMYFSSSCCYGIRSGVLALAKMMLKQLNDIRSSETSTSMTFTTSEFLRLTNRRS